MSKINISVQPTKSENIVKFVADSFLTQTMSYEFNTIDEAKLSPISQNLFQFPFVKTIYISQNFIAIDKHNYETSKVHWKDVQDEISLLISEYLNDGNAVITESCSTNNGTTINKNPITIYAESTPNPEVIKFVANKALANNTYEFKNKSEATHAPLAQILFNFPFVKEVFISSNYISITKTEDTEWDILINELREFIKNYIEDGKKIFNDEILKKEKTITQENVNTEFSEIDKEIISILNEYVKPAVEGDGGNIAFHSYDKETKTVRVILQGACSGCPSSTVTLKNGIETLLRQMLKGRVETVEAING